MATRMPCRSCGVAEELPNLVVSQEGDEVDQLQEGVDMHHVASAVPHLQVGQGGGRGWGTG